MIGLREVLENPRDDRPVVEQHVDEGDVDRPIDVVVGPDDPSASVVRIRRGELRVARPAAGRVGSAAFGQAVRAGGPVAVRPRPGRRSGSAPAAAPAARSGSGRSPSPSDHVRVAEQRVRRTQQVERGQERPQDDRIGAQGRQQPPRAAPLGGSPTGRPRSGRTPLHPGARRCRRRRSPAPAGVAGGETGGLGAVEAVLRHRSVVPGVTSACTASRTRSPGRRGRPPSSRARQEVGQDLGLDHGQAASGVRTAGWWRCGSRRRHGTRPPAGGRRRRGTSGDG